MMPTSEPQGEQMLTARYNHNTPNQTFSSYQVQRPILPAPLNHHLQQQQQQQQQRQQASLRNKRRMLYQVPCGIQGKQPGTVERRNARERNRVRLINHTFSDLRNHLPAKYTRAKNGKSKKMSKVDTLRSAIEYISQLHSALSEGETAVKPPQSDNQWYSALSPSSYSDGGSPGSSFGGSDSASDHCPTLDDEDELPDDLLDFNNWF
ncbi:achaete-scute homolog 1a [Lingula anatina]|uniref:Achaete-scute homolog 1a n=1 Tax=Lingula anatina TaxID=7574 RepID=A0A1S3JWK0_LINAN|nr:achaete-scute homolog 1a [Lingula anatina]|eukprot:XP_013414748.1 achaete-scute homolog 1a [Lingula anatina]